MVEGCHFCVLCDQEYSLLLQEEQGEEEAQEEDPELEVPELAPVTGVWVASPLKKPRLQ